MEAIKRKADALKQQHQTLLSKIQIYERDLNDINSKLEKNESEKVCLEGLLNEKSFEADTLHEKIGGVQEKLLEVEKSNLELQSVRGSCSLNKVSALIEKINAKKELDASLDEKIFEAEQKVSSMENELGELERQKQEYSEIIKTNDLEISKLVDELKHTQISREKNKSRTQALEDLVQSLNTRLKNEEIKRNELTASLTALETELLERENNISEANLKYENLTTEWEQTIGAMGI